MTGRRIIVANRLPYRVEGSGSAAVLRPSDGGLATGLRSIHEQGNSLWIGWPGAYSASREARAAIDAQLADARMIPVQLNAKEVKAYYEDLSNGALWPVFHSDLGQIPLEMKGWKEYEHANRKFAQAIIAQAEPGDTIWVHDYQLMLVPQMVREAMPNVRIGFFLHIPFPGPDVFRILPFREQILKSLLACDLVGFHVPAYLQNFVANVRNVLGEECFVDEIRTNNHTTRLGVFPLGIDAGHWQRLAAEPAVQSRIETLKQEARGFKLLMGIDRLDYTKGIPRRLLAIDRLLERYPEWRGKLRMIQVSVPSRESVESYGTFRRQVDELVGRINGRWSTEQWAPIHHIFRSIDEHEVAAFYRAADVMVVTPMRDGMNLVAKEFAGARIDGDGVLVISEFAGAASELGTALHVNPFDIDQTADRIHEALAMGEEERRSRMSGMRERVNAYTSTSWAFDFMRTLDEAPGTGAMKVASEHALCEITALVCGGRKRRPLHIVLDYDGTLVPLAESPELAAPGDDVKELLCALSRRRDTLVDVVSGRPRRDLEAWFSDLPIGLHAEHGIWSRPRGELDWQSNAFTDLRWKEAVHRILGYFLATTTGSFVEDKSTSVAWHYRRNQDDFFGGTDFGEYKARELRRTLSDVLASVPAYVLPGHKVVEITAAGLSKGIVARSIATDPAPIIVAIGDDRTDEDIFGALPADAITIRVGGGATRARYRLDGPADVRALLARFVEIPVAAGK